MIQEGLNSLLEADAGVLAIVGAQGVYPVAGPPDASKRPYVVYSCVGGSSDPTLRTSGVLRQRIEVSAFAATYAVAARLRAAVIAAVNGWQQQLDDCNVLNTSLLNPGTDFCAEDLVFRCMCEFYVLYTLAPAS